MEKNENDNNIFAHIDIYKNIKFYSIISARTVQIYILYNSPILRQTIMYNCLIFIL